MSPGVQQSSTDFVTVCLEPRLVTTTTFCPWTSRATAGAQNVQRSRFEQVTEPTDCGLVVLCHPFEKGKSLGSLQQNNIWLIIRTPEEFSCCSHEDSQTSFYFSFGVSVENIDSTDSRNEKQRENPHKLVFVMLKSLR